MLGVDHQKEFLSDVLERLDDRADLVRAKMEQASQADLKSLWSQLDISAVYHDCALDGQVVTPEELKAAFDPRAITDATSLQLYILLRSHKKAYEKVRAIASSGAIHFDLELFQQFNILFSPKPDLAAEGKFRQDIPLHRAYYHEISRGPQIKAQMTELLTWLQKQVEINKTDSSLHPIVFATQFHNRFMHIFPYSQTSGKIARAVMNLILVMNGYLPAIIHGTERQKYYEALKQSQGSQIDLVLNAAFASLDAAIRFLKRTNKTNKPD